MVDKEELRRYCLMACFCIFLSLGYSQGNENLRQLKAQINKAYQEGRYQEGIVLAEKAYNMSLSFLGERHPETIGSMNNLAVLYYSQGDYDKAEPMYVKTLQLTRELSGEKHPNSLILMNGLAELYRLQGYYNKSESLHLKTLQLMKEVLGEKHPDTLISISNLALLYSSQGEYSKAEPLSVKAFQLMKEVLGKKHPYTLSSMASLASLYKSQGEYGKSEPLSVDTLQLMKEVLGERHPNTLVSMNHLAALYESQGKYSKAEALYIRTLQLMKEVLGEKHSSTLISMNNLAGLYESQGKYSKAEALYKRTLQLTEEVLGERHPDTLRLMNNLAALYKSQGEYKKANSLYLKTLQIRIEVLGEKHPDTLISMNNLAGLYKLRREDSKAEPLYVKVSQISREVLGEKHPSALISMNNLALLYSSQGKYNNALFILKEHLAKKYLFLKRELRVSSEKTRLSMLDEFNVEYDKDNLFSILQEYQKEDFDSLALYFSVNYKGILLQISQELKEAFIDISDQDLLKELLDKRSVYSNLSLDYEKREKNRSLVEKLEKEIDELEKKLIWKSSDFKNLISDIKADEVKKAVLEYELLIDFVVYKSVITEKNEYKLAAVLVDKSDIKLVNLGEFKSVASLIKNYRSKIQKKQESKELSEKIYGRIFSPLGRYLKGKKKVYVVPDGVLHLLPFRSLINENGHYLTKSQNIVILSSSRDLVIKRTGKNNKSAVIFTYPNYGKGEGKEIVEGKTIHFSPLEGTFKEAQAISSLLDISKEIYSQGQATEKNISQIDSPQILHIATHGYFLDVPEETSRDELRGVTFKYKADALPMKLNLEKMSSLNKVSNSNRHFTGKKLTNPLVYSGLAFAGANNPGEDGILTALEVLGLDLHGTDLVVLSACETGVGEIRQGEGVYSLQRAFREAGAKSVLATLWKVDDQATQLFMEKFYKRYMSGESAQKAVRDTQLEFLGSKRYSHPFYWSSFVMIGGNSSDLAQEHIANVEEKELENFAISLILVTMIILVIALLILVHIKKEKKLVEERIAKRRKRVRKEDHDQNRPF